MPIGAVYTPEPLADFILDRLLDQGAELLGGRWLDPACGDGVFLSRLVDLLADRLEPAAVPAAVESTLFGIDIDPDACSLARERVCAAVARHCGEQPPDFFGENIECADFLATGPEALGSFTTIVGNPPYVSAESLSAAQKRDFLERFETAWGRLDLYLLFLEHALRMLAPGGALAFITPDKWLTATSSGPLRRYVAAGFQLRSVERFDRHDLFPGVATVPCVALIERPAGAPPRLTSAPTRHWLATPGQYPSAAGRAHMIEVKRDGSAWIRRSAHPRSQTVTLSELCERVSVGLATGLNRCFVLPPERCEKIEPELLRSVARGRDVRVEQVLDPGLQLLFPYTIEVSGTPRLIDLNDWPGAGRWLRRHRGALCERHCVRVWGKAWHDLHDPVTCDLAALPKILCPDLAREPRFAFDPGGLLPLHSAYYLLPRKDLQIGPQTLVAMLNTEAVARQLRRRAPTAKSGYRRLRAQVLREIRLPRITSELAELDAGEPGVLAELEQRTARAISDAA